MSNYNNQELFLIKQISKFFDLLKDQELKKNKLEKLAQLSIYRYCYPINYISEDFYYDENKETLPKKINAARRVYDCSILYDALLKKYSNITETKKNKMIEDIKEILKFSTLKTFTFLVYHLFKYHVDEETEKYNINGFNINDFIERNGNFISRIYDIETPKKMIINTSLINKKINELDHETYFNAYDIPELIEKIELFCIYGLCSTVGTYQFKNIHSALRLPDYIIKACDDIKMAKAKENADHGKDEYSFMLSIANKFLTDDVKKSINDALPLNEKITFNKVYPYIDFLGDDWKSNKKNGIDDLIIKYYEKSKKFGIESYIEENFQNMSKKYIESYIEKLKKDETLNPIVKEYNEIIYIDFDDDKITNYSLLLDLNTQKKGDTEKGEAKTPLNSLKLSI